MNQTDGTPEQPTERQTAGRRATRSKLAATGVVAAAALVATVVAIAVVFAGGSPPVPAQISVKEVINTVETDRPRGLGPVTEIFLPAVVGQELLPGDGLKTFANSEARVDISIGDYTRISRTKPNTVWRLGQFSLQEGTVIELDQGRIFLFDDVSDPTGRPFKVVTPAGTASPRGTWMSIAYDPVEQVAELQCFRGTCILENEFGAQVLKDGEKSVVTPVAAPVKPVVMTIDESTEFEELPEAETGEINIPTPEPTPEPTLEPTLPPPTPEPTTEPASAPKIVTSAVAGEPAGGSVPGVDPAPVPDFIPGPTPAPARLNTAIPVATPTAIPRPTPRPANKSVFNRAPTPTFVPTRLPTLTPIPDFKALFGPPTKEATEPVNIPLPPVDTTVLPHIFVGTVSINSVPAADGVEVTLWTYGFSEPLARSRVSDGTFTLLVPQYGPKSFNGRSLLFKVDNLIAEPTASWAAGGVDRLHLKVAPDKPDPLPTPEDQAQ